MKNNYFIFFLFIGVMLTCYAKKSVVTIGEKAPNFSLIGTDGKKHNLSEFKGKKVALYFFPKAGSFYCTKEATSLRDNFSALKKNNITVIGVSGDSPEKQKSFSEKYHLPFLLLSDPEQDVIKAYGAKGFLFNIFNKRKTFLINEQGIITTIITNVDVNRPAQQIINDFAAVEK